MADAVTVLIPWDKHDKPWLDEAIRSLPAGVRYLVAQNDSKPEMIRVLNACLDVVDTEYVFLMGADDKLKPGMLELLLTAIGESGDVAYPSMHLFGDQDEVFQAPVFSLHRLQDANVCGVFLARTRLLREHRWRDAPIEDWDLVYRMAHAGARFVPVPDAVYEYRQHTKSLSHRISSASKDAGLTTEKHRVLMTGQADRVRIRSLFVCAASPPQNYVRGVLPALGLPGVADQVLTKRNKYQAESTVWLHPGGDEDAGLISETRKAYGPVFADVDDGYASPELVPALRAAANQDRRLKPLFEAWRDAQPGHLRFVEECDGVVCATAALCELYQPLNANVWHVPNTVNEADWPGPQPHDGLIVAWAAGKQHLPDAPLIERGMRYAASVPDVRVVVVGVDPEWDFEYQHVPFTPSLQCYRDVLSLVDIGVAPVRKGGINAFKSDLKWLEYTMGGAACVVSDSECYSTIRGEALKASSPRGFEEAIRFLIMDERYRADLVDWSRDRIVHGRSYQMAAAAYQRILDPARQPVVCAA